MSRTEDQIRRGEDLMRKVRERKQNAAKPEQFDHLDLKWNIDGTLNTFQTFQHGRLLSKLHFAWNPDGSLSSIMREV